MSFERGGGTGFANRAGHNYFLAKKYKKAAELYLKYSPPERDFSYPPPYGGRYVLLVARCYQKAELYSKALIYYKLYIRNIFPYLKDPIALKKLVDNHWSRPVGWYDELHTAIKDATKIAKRMDSKSVPFLVEALELSIKVKEN